VIDDDGQLVGIVTDGDVRRAFLKADGSADELLGRRVSGVMTKQPTVVHPDLLAVEALRTMEDHQPSPIMLLPVVDGDGRAVGMIHLHTLVQAGLAADREP